jgi:hypothetical protein
MIKWYLRVLLHPRQEFERSCMLQGYVNYMITKQQDEYMNREVVS